MMSRNSNDVINNSAAETCHPEVSALTGYPSIDKPWLKYYKKENLDLKLPGCTVFDYIWQINKDYPNDTALEYFNSKISYSMMFDKVEQCAKALKSAGVIRGDSITLCVTGMPESIYLVLAASKIGVLANFINPLFKPDQMADRINDTNADLLFVMDKLYDHICDAIDKTCIKKVIIIRATESLPVGIRFLANITGKKNAKLQEALKDTVKYCYYRDFIAEGKSYKGSTEEAYQKDTPAIMVYSSGTTGASKGIVLTNDGINATLFYYRQYKGYGLFYNRGDSFLQMIPVWFSTGIIISVLMPLILGFHVIIEPVFSKESFAKDVAKYKPNLTLTATSLWIYAIHSKELKNMDLSQLTIPITGGEPLLPEVEKEINEFLRNHGSKAQLFKGYGMCELGGTITSTSALHSKPGSSGYPILHVEVSAFDQKTNKQLPYMSRGEIRAFSASRMKEYYKNSEATNEFFKTDAEGKVWGCTGDIGYVDEDGDVFIEGRATDCYVTDDGPTAYLFDIEKVLLKEPLINQCKATDIQEDGKTVLVAHIVLKTDKNDPTEEVIKRLDQLCRKELQGYAVPQYYRLWDALPVHPNGKRDIDTLKKERTGFIKAN